MDSIKQNKLYPYRYAFAFAAIGLVYFLNMFVDIMNVDAAQYASISLEMLQSGSYLEVYHKGHDYLDKPPMLFWLSSLSIGAFGITSFAYKLPAVLIILLGIYSTYRFTLMWYKKTTAIYAALILASTQAMFLVSNDVRTDGMLTGFVIFSVWQISRYLREFKWKYLFFGAIGVAFAMMTKGPLGIVLVAFAIGGDLLVKRQWKNIFKWQWIVFVVIIGIFLLPMSYGLYTQFDVHPEKEVYGLKGPSGLRFFYWTQSFGRITGENYWKNDAGFFFFFHTILWDFQPWVLFLIPALFNRFKTLFLSKFRIPNTKEFISFSGFILGFLALSKSGFKLPHYIFPLFPFAAIFTADYITSLANSKITRRFARFQFGFLHLFYIIPILSFIYIFSPSSVLLPILLIILFILFWLIYKKTSDPGDKIILPTVITAFAFGLITSTYFYPNLLKYQSSSIVGKEITKRNIPKDEFYMHGVHGHSLDFYGKRITKGSDQINLYTCKKGTLIYTDEKGMMDLCAEDGPGFKILSTYDDFGVTGISIDFLLKDTRENVLDKRYLLEKQ